LSKFLPGIVSSFIIASISWHLGGKFPVIGVAVFSILTGMLISSVRSYPVLAPGAGFAAKKFLQLSIVLIGFDMNMFRVLEVGAESIIVMLFTFSAAFLTAWAAGKFLNLNSNTVTLIGVGTAVCGGSAIAAAAPIINADDKDIAHSISTIFLFNIIAIFVFPAIGRVFGMSDTGFGILAGTAINDTSSVLAAGYSYSDRAGELATIVKLTRTLTIIPITFVLSVYVSGKSANKSKLKFSFLNAFPWFVAGFILASTVNTFGGGIIPSYISRYLVISGRFLIAAAMAAIGLNTDLVKLVKSGSKPIFLGFSCWIAVSLVSVTVQYFMGLL